MEPKLTIEEAKGAWNATFHLHAKSFEEYCADLLKRGLIAPEPEPVDPLLEEAETLHGEWVDGLVGEHGDTIDLALAALKRGMELQREAQPVLTHKTYFVEEVIDLLQDAGTTSVRMEYSEGWHDKRRDLLNRLHAALTQPPHADKEVG